MKSIYDGLRCVHCSLIITGTSEDDDELMVEHHVRAHPNCREHIALVEELISFDSFIERLADDVGPLGTKKDGGRGLLN